MGTTTHLKTKQARCNLAELAASATGHRNSSSLAVPRSGAIALSSATRCRRQRGINLQRAGEITLGGGGGETTCAVHLANYRSAVTLLFRIE